MATLCFSKFFLTVTILSLLTATTTTSLPTIGVTYTHPSLSTATPETIAATLQSLKITAVRLPEPEPALIRAFSYTSISLLLSIPNSLIPSLASNRSTAATWLYTYVVPFYPRAHISAISVGDDVLATRPELYADVLSAIRNLHVVLHELGIRRISVSTTLSLSSALTTAFPPSSAEFQEPINDIFIRPLLDFLQEANSTFMINLHPYTVYRMATDIPVGFALFQEGPFNFRDDFTTGVRYRNLFDTMVDAVLCAMAVAGHENIPVIVTETGWPSSPGPDQGEETDANMVFADLFLKGLVKHLRSGNGTPLKKEGVSEVYIYELFDGKVNQSSVGPVRQWGILYPNLTTKYHLDLSGSGSSRTSAHDGFMWFLLIALLLLFLASANHSS